MDEEELLAQRVSAAQAIIAERSFVCPYPNCTSAYNRKGNLQAHIKQKHIAIEYRCEVPGCNKVYHRKAHLKRHRMAIHENVEFRCVEDGCDKVFRYKHLLEEHKRVKHKIFSANRRSTARTEGGSGTKRKRVASGDGSEISLALQRNLAQRTTAVLRSYIGDSLKAPTAAASASAITPARQPKPPKRTRAAAKSQKKRRQQRATDAYEPPRDLSAATSTASSHDSELRATPPTTRRAATAAPAHTRSRTATASPCVKRQRTTANQSPADPVEHAGLLTLLAAASEKKPQTRYSAPFEPVSAAPTLMMRAPPLRSVSTDRLVSPLPLATVATAMSRRSAQRFTAAASAAASSMACDEPPRDSAPPPPFDMLLTAKPEPPLTGVASTVQLPPLSIESLLN